MRAQLRTAVERALGVGVAGAESVAGGDINQAFVLSLADRRRVFMKTNDACDPAMFTAEARGLKWLADAAALRVPRVLAAAPESAGSGEPAFLVLEWIESAPPRAGFDDELGRGLAALHQHRAPCFGLDHDNFIGRLPQPNAAAKTWVEFYRVRRLEVQLRLAVDARRVDAGLIRKFDRLFARLEALLGAPEPPARLHGDLWGGNLHVDENGGPCLIDPAVYGGHREVDLAMMRLFGGFGARVFQAYHEAFPLSADHAERVPLYQLYPLLVHTNLFGQSYAASVERALSRYV
jgi:fructosamine-3-kinase